MIKRKGITELEVIQTKPSLLDGKVRAFLVYPNELEPGSEFIAGQLVEDAEGELTEKQFYDNLARVSRRQPKPSSPGGASSGT